MLCCSKSPPKQRPRSKAFKLSAKLAVFALLLQVFVPTVLGLFSSSANAAGSELMASPSFCAMPGSTAISDPAKDQTDDPEIPQNSMVLCVFCFVCQLDTSQLKSVVSAAEYSNGIKSSDRFSVWISASNRYAKFKTARHATRAPPSFI